MLYIGTFLCCVSLHLYVFSLLVVLVRLSVIRLVCHVMRHWGRLAQREHGKEP